MKNFLYPLFFLALTGFSSLSFGQESNPSQPQLLERLAVIVQNCAVAHVQRHSDRYFVESFGSRCQVFHVESKGQAQIYLGGQWYTAKVTENADSDGGDLDDLTVLNDQGQIVATRTAVAAFDDVVYALSGLGSRFVPLLQD
jgi:hypothetical protein